MSIATPPKNRSVPVLRRPEQLAPSETAGHFDVVDPPAFFRQQAQPWTNEAQPVRLPRPGQVSKTSARPSPWSTWFWQLVIAGFLTFGKSCASFGAGPIMVSEPLLAFYLLRNRQRNLISILTDLARMRTLTVAVFAVLAWGMWDVVRPVFEHVDIVQVLRTSAFDYYPLFILVGICLGREIHIGAFVKYWKSFVLMYAGYTAVYYTVGEKITAAVPWGGHAPIFMIPWNPPFAPLVVLTFWPLWRKWKWKWVVLPASMMPMLVSTGRGSFLGFAFGAFALCIASRRHRHLIFQFLVGAALTLSIVGPLIKGEKGRNANLDPYIQVCRVVATANPDMAYDMLKSRGYDEAADDIIVARGTAIWRQKIWTACMHSLDTPALLYMGQGHGAALVKYVPDGQEITTPHNFLIYATFYTGEIGAGLFLVMLLCLLLAGRKIKDPYLWGLFTANIVATVTVAAVGNALETPMVAVPFYLVSGLCLGIRTQGTPLRGMVGQRFAQRDANVQTLPNFAVSPV